MEVHICLHVVFARADLGIAVERNLERSRLVHEFEGVEVDIRAVERALPFIYLAVEIAVRLECKLSRGVGRGKVDRGLPFFELSLGCDVGICNALIYCFRHSNIGVDLG